MRYTVFALTICAAPAMAHDLQDITVNQVAEKGSFVSVLLSDTVKGTNLSCALYNAEGETIAQESWIAENLATEVLIRAPAEPVASARCVVSE